MENLMTIHHLIPNAIDSPLLSGEGLKAMM
jgi:hypothetical protein